MSIPVTQTTSTSTSSNNQTSGKGKNREENTSSQNVTNKIKVYVNKGNKETKPSTGGGAVNKHSVDKTQQNAIADKTNTNVIGEDKINRTGVSTAAISTIAIASATVTKTTPSTTSIPSSGSLSVASTSTVTIPSTSSLSITNASLLNLPPTTVSSLPITRTTVAGASTAPTVTTNLPISTISSSNTLTQSIPITTVLTTSVPLTSIMSSSIAATTTTTTSVLSKVMPFTAPITTSLSVSSNVVTQPSSSLTATNLVNTKMTASIASTTTIGISSNVPANKVTFTTSSDRKPIEMIETLPKQMTAGFVPKEKEMFSTIANIKQEKNQVPSAVFAPKDMSMFIKKEPRDDSVDNSNSNSNEPQDLKLITSIKTEGKCGLDLTDHDTKFADNNIPKSNFGAHIKYGPPMPPNAAIGESHSKYPAEAMKYCDPMKFSQDPYNPTKYQLPPITMPPTTDPSKYHPDTNIKYEMKPLFMELPGNKYSDGNGRIYHDGPNADGQPSLPPGMKGHSQESLELKYSAPDGHKFIPPNSEPPIKYENSDNTIIKRPPFTESHQNIRSPYENSQVLKYSDPMQKYHGLPPSTRASPHPQDLKYMPPLPPGADMKYKLPENLTKSQFTADNLMKSNSYADYPSNMKYPPVESPLDASSRSTPNQDSQSSNSNNTQPIPILHHSSLPSPHTNSPHTHQSPHLHPGIGPMILGQPPLGLPPHPSSISNIPSSNSSLLPISSSPNSTTATSLSAAPIHHVPNSTPTSVQAQPLSLIGSNSGPLIPPSSISTSVSHSSLHRPHQELAPSALLTAPIHHPSVVFSSALGLPPSSTSNSHGQTSSPALGGSRSEQERNEQQRRLESLHHRASPGLLPGS